MCHMDQAPVGKHMAMQRAKEKRISEETCPEEAGENQQGVCSVQAQCPRNVLWGRGTESGQEMGVGQATPKPQEGREGSGQGARQISSWPPSPPGVQGPR